MAGKPRIGVLGAETAELQERLSEAGGRPLGPEPPDAPPGGITLSREWFADVAEAWCLAVGPDALLVRADRSAEQTAGHLLAALRSNLPTVLLPGGEDPFGAAACALGLAPLDADPAALVVELARGGGLHPREVFNGFSLANALRAGLAAGGAELLVHLAAAAREAGEVGFSQMIRVLAPEAPALSGPPGTPHLLALLGEVLHDVRTVEGGMLKAGLPDPPRERPDETRRVRFVTGRASGVEAVVVAPVGVEEVAGSCRVFGSEAEAAEAVSGGRVGDGELLVVAGCGPRGGPGLLGLDALGEALRAVGSDAPVVTDGLPPDAQLAGSPWVSLFTPEAAAGGVIGRLQDGDFLRFDLAQGRIRTDVPANELGRREPFKKPETSGFGYVARYARSALPALEGAGFG